MPALVIAALLTVSTPGAWGEHGHRIICGIAWQRLTPAARLMVERIRAADPAPGESFAASCLWADEVRRTTHRETEAYHYINIPPGSSGVDLARDCADTRRRCAPWAIRHYALALLDSARSGVERAEALKFLAHFVGDIHQPLHAGRAEDRGGNTIFVDFFGEREADGDSLNLHWVWDTWILRRAGVVWPDSAAALDGEITPVLLAEWQTTDVLTWVNESYRLDETLVYALPPDKRIDAAYFEAASAAARLGLKRAGARLAYLLNRIAEGVPVFDAAPQDSSGRR